MKKLPLLFIGILLLSASIAEARLGETKEQIFARMGTPLSSKNNVQIEGDEAYHFKQDSMDIMVILYKGISVTESYDSKTLTYDNAKAILSGMQNGEKWSERKAVYDYIFKSPNGRYTALYRKLYHVLVITDGTFDEEVDKAEKAKLKKF